MVGTICPVGDGKRRTSQRFVDALCFFAACVLGGVTLGALFGSLGEFAIAPLFNDVVLASAVSAFAALAMLADFGVIRVPLSPFPRQVESISWERYSRPVVATRWGFEQGLGLLTHVHWSGFYLAIVLTIVLGLPLGLIVMGSYAAIRGAQPLVLLLLANIGNNSTDFFDEFSRAYPTFALPRMASLAAVAAVPLAIQLGNVA